MQRVAIARALVNNPDILLADEPTGALDSKTSIQIMDLLKEIATEKLVIMVTHNKDLAEKYSTRIINLKDGNILEDSNVYESKDLATENKKIKVKKTSMKFFTALGFSLNNLLSKKGRTILTSFAGSIGIIGIAMILSLSTGVQDYIDRVQKETLSSYPISIESNTVDMTAMFESSMGNLDEKTKKNDNKISTQDDITNNPYLVIQNSIYKNNLEEFKKYLDKNKNKIDKYTTDIQYDYNIDLQIYSDYNKKIVKVNPNTLNLMPGISSNYSDANLNMQQNDVFQELISSKNLFTSQYEILSGKAPTSYNELILIVDENNTIPMSVMYALNIENRDEINNIFKKILNDEKVKIDKIEYDFNELIGLSYKLVSKSNYYEKIENIWVDKSDEQEYLRKLVENGTELKIVGIAKISDNAVSATSGFIGYTHELSNYIINESSKTQIVKNQLENPKINIFTGKNFDDLNSSYENNLSMIGYADLKKPETITIYPTNFQSKEKIQSIIDDYNKNKPSSEQIIYTDLVGSLMSGVVSIVNVITYILIAFVSVSLIVSSIMISIITYISVLERTKEIGILRAVGASKKNISRVFNAETVIEGFIAGMIGVSVTYLLGIPINAIVENGFGISKICYLQINHAIILVCISVVLTVIAGIIPAKIASKKDPVQALRSE